MAVVSPMFIGSASQSSLLEYASVAIAVLSLVVSVGLGLRNQRIARQALELAERQEERRVSRLVVHLNESVAWRQAGESTRVLGFHLLITNPSDRATSLVRAELRRSYSVDGIVTTVKLDHATSLASGVVPGAVVLMELPLVVGANSAVSGWFLFRVAGILTGGRPVERYDVVLRDVHDVEETLQVTLFRETSDVKAT